MSVEIDKDTVQERLYTIHHLDCIPVLLLERRECMPKVWHISGASSAVPLLLCYFGHIICYADIGVDIGFDLLIAHFENGLHFTMI